MNTFEFLAIVPDLGVPIADDRLYQVATAGYIAILAKAPRQIIKLPQSRRDALKFAAERQALLEACMPLGAVLAVRSGVQMAPDEAHSLIIANTPLLDRLTKRLHGKVQFQVSVHWDQTGVLHRFRDAPELSDIFAKGRVSGTQLAPQLAALARRLTSEMLQSLRIVASEVIELPMEEHMLLNAVVLQETDNLPALDDAIEAIDAIWTEGLQIKQIGPAPAASFALLNPQLISASDVNAAAKRLAISPLSPLNDNAQARRRALLNDADGANEITRCADILDAASRLGRANLQFHMLTVMTEGQASQLPARKVA